MPLFILVGELMNEGGIARRLMSMSMAMIGSMKGGLAYVNLISNMMMASILGSTVAQITIMTRMAVPEMERAGYKKDRSGGIDCSRGPAGSDHSTINVICYFWSDCPNFNR